MFRWGFAYFVCCVAFYFRTAPVLSLEQLTPSITVADALNRLKLVMTGFDMNPDHEQSVRNFFHQHCAKEVDPTLSRKPANCADLLITGDITSGVYTIYPKPWNQMKKMKVYCDMETDGGGWTVIQRRDDYPGRQINFTRNWSDYAHGFGNLNEEFWLGNDNIHVLTAQDDMELRVELESFKNGSRYAEYDTMKLGNRLSNYVLTLGRYFGNGGDHLRFHSSYPFVTYDKDIYGFDGLHCAQTYKGGWWYHPRVCYDSNLNGVYKRGIYTGRGVGINWGEAWLGWYNSLKKTEMKIRPNFLR